MLAAGLAGAGEAPPRPPVVIASLGVTPRYPAFDVEYPDGLPQVVDPDTGRPLDPDEARRIQRWPRSGEPVTVTARIVNRGEGPTGPLRLAWVVNRRRLPEERHPGLTAAAVPEALGREWPLSGVTLREAPLAPGSFADLALQVEWRRNRTIRLEVRPDGSEPAPVAAREGRLDGLAVLAVVSRSAYSGWPRGAEAPRFEEWAQEQASLLQGRMALSVYATAPRGADQPFRIDTLRVVEDDADLDALRAAAARNGWDGVWTCTEARSPVEGEQDPEWFRQALAWLGVADLRALAVLPADNRAVLEGTDAVQPGFQPAAVPSAAAESLPEHAVLALNRMSGQRRGHRGSYLFDLPRRLRLRVLDNAGRPVPEADLVIYQKEAAGVPATPLATGRTNPNGELSLPRRRTPTLETADGFTLTDNPFGLLKVTGENGLFLVQVRARGAVEHLWLPVTTLNLAHWRELGREVTIDLRTRIPARDAPAPVAGLTARAAQRAGADGALLRWTLSDDRTAACILYRARYPTFQFERLVGLTTLHREHFDPLRDPHPVRYGVTTVDLTGNESALRTAVLAP